MPRTRPEHCRPSTCVRMPLTRRLRWRSPRARGGRPRPPPTRGRKLARPSADRGVGGRRLSSHACSTRRAAASDEPFARPAATGRSPALTSATTSHGSRQRQDDGGDGTRARHRSSLAQIPEGRRRSSTGGRVGWPRVTELDYRVVGLRRRRGRLRRRLGPAARGARRASRRRPTTPSCCWSTRRSTPPASAPSRTSVRSTTTSRSSTSTAAARSPSTGPASWSATRSSGCPSTSSSSTTCAASRRR